MGNPNTPEQDRILARVRKMMALANDAAASEGERDNALRMAHATLIKHNLTMAAAEEAGAAAEETREKDSTTSRDQPWCREVSHAVATLFFCAYWYSRGATKKGTVKHNFVGLAGNVATAKAMTDYLIKSIMSEANKRWKDQADPGAWWTSFCKGAASRIRERCHELRAAAEKPEDTKQPGTALMVVSLYKAEAEKNALVVKLLGVELHHPKSRAKAAGDGYADGRTYGNGLSLNRQVGGAAKTNLRIA